MVTKAKRKVIRLALYLRCSDKKQDTSVKDQRKSCVAFVARNQVNKQREHDYKIVCEYVDDGISGDDTEKRFDFLRMRDDAGRDIYDAILCWDQDRFGRFDMLKAGKYIDPLREAGVFLLTVGDGKVD